MIRPSTLSTIVLLHILVCRFAPDFFPGCDSTIVKITHCASCRPLFLLVKRASKRKAGLAKTRGSASASTENPSDESIATTSRESAGHRMSAPSNLQTSVSSDVLHYDAGQLRVLVYSCDGDKSSVAKLKKFIKSLGYRVLCAATLADAVDANERDSIDLIIANQPRDVLSLSNMSEWQHRECPVPIPILAVVERAEPSLVSALYQFGVTSVLSCSMDIPALLRGAIGNCLLLAEYRRKEHLFLAGFGGTGGGGGGGGGSGRGSNGGGGGASSSASESSLGWTSLSDRLHAAETRRSMALWKARFFAGDGRQAAMMQREVAAADDAVSAIRHELITALVSPVQTVLALLEELGRSQTLPEHELRRAVQRVIKLIQRNDPFEPEFDDLVRTFQLDVRTRSWLQNYYSLGTFGRPRERRPAVCAELVSPMPSGDMLSDWAFDQFQHADEQLLAMFIEMVKHFDLHTIFGLDDHVLYSFAAHIKKRYRDNPYHNWRHAFDVTQTVFSLLVNTSCVKYLSDVDVFALLVSAIAHDVEHPGVNQAFLVATHDPLALLYNDRSVLENHHAATLFRVLANEECNLLRNLSPGDAQSFRRVAIEAILATDMKGHFALASAARARVQSGVPLEKSNEDSILVVKFILHIADVSNQAKPFNIAQIWTSNITEEFWNQGDREVKLGLPISPLCDRNDPTPVSKGQISFIDFVVKPLFEILDSMFDGARPMLDRLKATRKCWEDISMGELNRRLSINGLTTGAADDSSLDSTRFSCESSMDSSTPSDRPRPVLLHPEVPAPPSV